MKKPDTSETPEKAKAPRKIVTNLPVLLLFTQQPDDHRKEALYFMDAMPGITFEQAVKLAMFNHGRADHPVYTSEKVEDLIHSTAPPSA